MVKWVKTILFGFGIVCFAKKTLKIVCSLQDNIKDENALNFFLLIILYFHF